MTRITPAVREARLMNLQRVTDAALAHLSLDDLLDELLARIVEILDTDTAAILMLNDREDTLVARAARGLEEEVERGVRIPVGAGFAGRVVSERRPIAIEDIDTAEILNPLLREKGLRSLLGVPLAVEGRVIGVLHVGTLTRRKFSDDDIQLLQLVADRSALAIEHARLFESERLARMRAERDAARLAQVQRVTDAALAHLSLDALLDELLARIVEILSTDTAAILMLNDRGDTLVARAARGLEEEVERGVRIPVGAGFAGRVVSERRPIAIEDIDTAEILNPLLREKGLRSLLGVPLAVEGRVIGVLHVGTLTRRKFSDDDIRLLQLVADRSALAIEHARLFERERAIAEAVQRSLLPDRLPALPGMAVAARYLPARAEADVGGDWYDVIPLKQGAVGLAIGDVVGRGASAAALMGQLRSALRAYALEGHPPAAAIGRLNRLTHRLMPGRMATALYLVLDLQTSALSFANAGHLPPLVMRADGTTSFLDQGTAEPLGVLGHATYAPVEDTLGNGSTLVLCTDGLIERRSEGLEDGLARLRSLVADGPTAPSELCDHIIRDSLGPSGAEDDVALLVLRALPISSERMDLKLAADPDELANLRRVLGRWLHVIGASAEEAYDITVACTEASANAVEHAYSPEDATFEVEAAMRDGEVAVTVRDSGRWRPARGVHRGRGLQIMKSLMDEVEITPGEQGTTVQLRRRVSGKASS